MEKNINVCSPSQGKINTKLYHGDVIDLTDDLEVRTQVRTMGQNRFNSNRNNLLNLTQLDNNTKAKKICILDNTVIKNSSNVDVTQQQKINSSKNNGLLVHKRPNLEDGSTKKPVVTPNIVKNIDMSKLLFLETQNEKHLLNTDNIKRSREVKVTCLPVVKNVPKAVQEVVVGIDNDDDVILVTEPPKTSTQEAKKPVQKPYSVPAVQTVRKVISQIPKTPINLNNSQTQQTPSKSKINGIRSIPTIQLTGSTSKPAENKCIKTQPQQNITVSNPLPSWFNKSVLEANSANKVMKNNKTLSASFNPVKTLEEIVEAATAVANIEPSETEVTQPVQPIIYLLYPLQNSSDVIVASNDPNQVSEDKTVPESPKKISEEPIILDPEEQISCEVISKHSPKKIPEEPILLNSIKCSPSTTPKNKTTPRRVLQDPIECTSVSRNKISETFFQTSEEPILLDSVKCSPTIPKNKTTPRRLLQDPIECTSFKNKISPGKILQDPIECTSASRSKIPETFFGFDRPVIRPVDISKILDKGKKRQIRSRCGNVPHKFTKKFSGFSDSEENKFVCTPTVKNLLKREFSRITVLRSKLTVLNSTLEKDSHVIYCSAPNDNYLPETLKSEDEDDDSAYIENQIEDLVYNAGIPTIGEVISQVNEEVRQIKEQEARIKRKKDLGLKLSKPEQALKLIKEGLELIQSWSKETHKSEEANKPAETPKRCNGSEAEVPVVKKRRARKGGSVEATDYNNISETQVVPVGKKRRARKKRSVSIEATDYNDISETQETSVVKKRRDKKQQNITIKINNQLTDFYNIQEVEAVPAVKKRRRRKKESVVDIQNNTQGMDYIQDETVTVKSPKKRRRNKVFECANDDDNELLIVKKVDIIKQNSIKKRVRKRKEEVI